jgi:hypothetical protein
VSVERVGSLGASLTVSGGSLHLGLVLLLGTCIGKHELLPTLLRGAHRTLRPHEKVSTEASNLSKGEMCFNLSLSISFQVFITREQDLWAPRVLEPEAGSGLLQASPSHSRGELREHHMFVMPRPVYNTPGGRSRTSSSSTTSRGGGCHQRLQLRWWPLPEIPTAPLRRPAIDVFIFGGGRCQTYRQHHLGAHHQHLQLWWWSLLDLPTAPQGGPPSTSSISMVATTKNPDNTPRGPAIVVFNFSGGRCRKSRQHPQGAHHRRLQLRWWPLLGVPPSMSPTLVVASARPADNTPQGARHQHLQLQWWPLPKILTAPLGGMPSTSSTSVVATAGPPDNTS